MNEAVRNMALSYKFSANEGAQALYFLSSAGFSVGESLRALSGVTLLAQGTLSDLAQTADTIANTISAFGLSAADSTRIANLFAASISVTQATMDKLAYSMRYVAPIAASMGASVEQTTVALSLLYNAGNRGQQAGTLLRDILVRLVNPSKEASEILSTLGVAILDDTGKTRNFVDILKELSSFNLSPVTLSKLFEQRGVSGAQTLLGSFDPGIYAKKLKDTDFAAQVDNIAKRANIASGSIRNMFELMEAAQVNTNFATKLAIEQNNTLAGSFARAKNAMVEVGLTVGEQLAPGLTSIANSFTGLVQTFRALDDGTKKLLTDLPLLVLVGVGISKAFGGVQGSVLGALNSIAGLRSARNDLSSAREALDALRRAEQQLVTNTGQPVSVNRAGGYYLSAGQPGGGQAVARNNVTTQQQLAERQFQQQREQYARTVALGGAAAAAAQRPVAPLGGAEGRAAIISAATSVAGSTLGIMTSIVGAVFSVLSIGVLVAAAWPFIKEYLNAKPGTSDLGKPQEDTSRQDIQAVLSTPASGPDHIKSLQGLVDSKNSNTKFFEQALESRKEIQKAAQKQLVDYVAAQYELNGDIAKAKEIRDAGNVEMIELLANRSGSSGELGFLAEDTQAKGIVNSETFLKLKKQQDDANRAAESAAITIANGKAYVQNVLDKQKEIRDLPLTKTQQAEYEALNNLKLQQGGDQLIVLLNGWVNGLQQKSREAQITAAKAAAELSKNPIDKYIAEIVESQSKLLNKLSSARDEIKQKFDAELGTEANNTLSYKFKGQIGSLLAGLNWTEIFHDEISGQEYKETHLGITELIQKGLSPEEAFAEFRKGIDVLIAQASQQNPAVKQKLQQLRELTISQYQAIIAENKTDLVKGLFEVIQHQREGRQFYQKLRDELTGYNNDIFSALDTATGGEIPQFKFRVDFSNAKKKLADELQKQEQNYFELVKSFGGQSPNISPEKLKEITDRANSTVQPAIDAATRAYVIQAENIINAAKNAQLKVKVDTANALASAQTTQSQINADLADLYVRLGVNVPKAVFQSAADLEFNQIGQKLTAQLGQLQQEKQQLEQYLAKLKELQEHPERGLAGGQLPAAPLSLVGGSAEQMLEAIKRGTEFFQEAFGTKLNIFTNNFDAVLQKFLTAFGGRYNGGVQVPAQPQNYIAPGTSGGLQSGASLAAITVQSPKVTLANSGGGNGDFLFKTNYANPGNAPIGGGQSFGVDNGLSFKANAEAGQALKGFVNDLIAAGAPIRSVQGEAVRNIAGTNTLSQHAYGNAIDVNQSARDQVSADFRQWIEQNQSTFRDALKNNGVISGGDFRNPDLGHFEYGGRGAGTPQQDTDPAKVAQVTALYQQRTDTVSQLYGEMQKIPAIEQQAANLTADQTQQINQQVDATQKKLQFNQQALNTTQQEATTFSSVKLSPDAQDSARWQEWQREVATAQRTLAGSQDMMKGFQVANAQLANQVGNGAKMAADTYAAAANSIATNLTALIVGTQKDWRVALRNIATDIATTIIKALILRTLTGLGGGLLGGLGAAPASVAKAMGGAYGMGGQEVPVAQFAGGGVFDSPTMFQYGGGRKGVMGEAGPEAIMPLVRGPDGKLAVRAITPTITPISRGNDSGGGGISYSPNFTFYGGDGQSGPTPTGNSRQERNRLAAMQKELDREMEATFVRVASKHQRGGGMFNQSAQRLGLAGGT